MRKKFVYSRNTEVKKHLNPRTGKLPTGGNFASFNSNWEPVETEIGDLAVAMSESYGLCAWHLLDGKRVANNTGCIQAGLIIIDIDNQADYKSDQGDKVQEQHLTVEEALELDKLCSFTPMVKLSEPTELIQVWFVFSAFLLFDSSNFAIPLFVSNKL